VRSFAGDHSGRICVDTTGAKIANGAASLPLACTDLQ
jgi:hypothetical protein